MNVFLFFPRATLGEEKTSPLLRKRNSSQARKFFCAFAFVPSLFPVMKFCFLLGKKTSRREKKTLVFPTQSPLVSVVLGKRKSCEQFRLRQFIYLILSISQKNIIPHSPSFKVRESNLDFLLLGTKTGLLRNPLSPSPLRHTTNTRWKEETRFYRHQISQERSGVDGRKKEG